MLIITRHSGETIHIGNDTTIKVLSVRDSQVRLGIEAPRNVSVWRGELWEQEVPESIPVSSGGERCSC
jgi:carbon storage regulator